MGQVFSQGDTEYSRTGPTRPTSKRSSNPGPDQPKPERVRSRRHDLGARVRVPMLDWPSDLYSDNVGTAELMSEDWAIQCDSEALSHGWASSGLYVQAAAWIRTARNHVIGGTSCRSGGQLTALAAHGRERSGSYSGMQGGPEG